MEMYRQLCLPATLEAPAKARRFLADTFGSAGLSEDLVAIVLLLASELVTNAVVHGRSEVGLEVDAPGDLLRVSVHDENSRPPRIEDDDPDALDGRGMQLVDALAEQWGVEQRPIGKAVWFTVRSVPASQRSSA